MSPRLADVGLVWIHGGAELWGMRLDGRGERPLWPAASLNPFPSLAWSPDGNHIAYYVVVDGQARLHVADTRTGRRSAMRGGSVCSDSVSFSPDGRSIICVGGEDGAFAYVVSRGRARLVDEDDGPGDFSIGEPAWGPNGLLVGIGWSSLALFGFRPRLRLIREISQPGSDYNQNPAWSPDGRWVAFQSPDAKSHRDRIWIASTVKRELRALTWGDNPQFSPDGGWIAFDSDRSGDREIYVMRRDGSDVRRVTHRRGDDSSPVWRPRRVS